MAKVERVEIAQVDLAPQVRRSDAIQSFVTQETVFVTLRCADGSTGTGYTYTIGTGGSSIVALLRDHLAPQLLGRDARQVEAIWRDLYFHTHANAVGAITSLALAAVDTALWDRKARAAGLPLWQLAGGAKDRVPLYTTEGGWLHLEPAELVEQSLAAREQGFLGAKLKVGKPRLNQDMERLAAVREALGPGFELMVDANQCFTYAEAVRRAQAYAELDLAWLEEPMPAQHIAAHAQLRAATGVPIAVGESIYDLGQFGDYVTQGACSIVQADVARIGGITPWLKVAHLAEACNLAICPHFLMELHVSLCAAVPNSQWVEYIPQLDALTTSRMTIADGHALAPTTPGLGIEWDVAAIKARQRFEPIVLG
ncbi:MAG: mandelate racemase/muconate lactonizing enzyme family protein [Burkholderiales bacterium]|nr:mandelate racemase/muconate lactonizing enzyme family protein [Burkholderiales bacterium]